MTEISSSPSDSEALPADQSADARNCEFQAVAELEEELRSREDEERKCLLTAASQAMETTGGLPEDTWDVRLQVRRLQAELESLREFRSAVIGSKAWRLLQLLRGLVRRRW